MNLGVIRSRPTAYSTITIQHNNLNRKNIIQNQKYKCKKIKLIYLIFIYCICKFEKYEQSFPSENYEQTSTNKKHKQSTATCARACYVGR